MENTGYGICFLIAGFLVGGLIAATIKKLLNREKRIEQAAATVGNSLFYLGMYAIYGASIEAILYSLCFSILLILSVVDWHRYEIPISCNIGIGVLGAVRLLTDLSHWRDYCIGLVFISGLLFLVYGITKGNGIGGGDIKLMAAAGLLLGWQKNLVAFLLGCILGSVIHLCLMKWKGKDRVLAFGPYLSAGIALTMCFGEQIWNWYLGLLF